MGETTGGLEGADSAGSNAMAAARVGAGPLNDTPGGADRPADAPASGATPAAASASTSASLEAPAEWMRIDFISDLHLSATTPLTLALWADYLADTTADAVFILGDLFEAWVGDDSRTLPAEARCVQALAEASRRIPVYFMAGNRDFLVGPDMLSACGMQALSDPTTLVAFGRRVLLTHGDEWCLSDLPYLRFRAMVRNPAWQKQILAQPLAARLAMARMLRDGTPGSSSEGAAAAPAWVDVDKAELIARMRAAGAPEAVHGHTHRPGTEVLAGDATRHVLTDWDVDADPAQARAEVLRLSAGGFERISLTALRQGDADGQHDALGRPDGPAGH